MPEKVPERLFESGRVRFACEQNEEIDVRERKQLAAAVTSDRDQCERNRELGAEDGARRVCDEQINGGRARKFQVLLKERLRRYRRCGYEWRRARRR